MLMNLFPDKKYDAILADPPWNFIVRSPKGLRKSANMHYNCMSLEDIAHLNVGRELGARDCALFMWVTPAFLMKGIYVMECWGFEYKSAAAWAKQSKTGRKWAFGTGYIFRNAAEFLLVGTKGRPKWLSKKDRNLIIAPVREHSRKPDCVYEMIDRMIEGDRIELFCRGAAWPGWDNWGDEAT